MTISEIGFLKSGIFVADKIGYMELDQYNFKQFQDGLTDILNKPWKEPVFIQDAIPTFPEVNDEDRPVHNLIMLQFIDERLLRPYYSTVGYLLLNKAYFLKYILETYSTKADFVAMFEGSSRLTFNEIYEAFNGMGPTNASFLLDRIDCPVSVYTRLKESLERKEETKFAEAIDECDISNILPALKYILFIKQQVKKLDSPDPQGKEGTNMDFETAKQKLLYEIETDMTEKHGISPNSPLKQDIMGYYDELFSLMYNPNELLESFYPPLFCQYCQMKKGGGLNDSDVKAFEYIFHQPAFEEQYERCLQLWETGELEGMFSKQSEEDSLNEDGGKEAVDSVAANKKEQQSTPQIEEPGKEEVKDVPKRLRNAPGQRGRRNGRWIKGRSQIGDEQIGALIQRDIWDSLVKSVNGLKFQDGVAGKTRDTRVRYFSAALLYYILEKIGWARVFSESGVQSSFCKRTMKFAHIARSSFINYITHLHDWYLAADAIKERQTQQQYLFLEWQKEDKNMAFLIFKNLSAIGGLIEEYERKIKKILDENCKL